MSEARQHAERWLRTYYGSIDSTALIMAHEAGQRSAQVRAVREADLARMTAKPNQAVSLPDRTTLIMITSKAMLDSWSDAREYEDSPEAIADAVLAALSTQPAAGPTDGIPEADATPDEAFELGRVSGYDEAMREVTQPAAGEVEWGYGKALRGKTDNPAISTSREVAERETDEWNARIRPRLKKQGDRDPGEGIVVKRVKAGPWIEAEPEPAPELAELFPGTLAALDHLSIRPEVQ